MSSGSGIGGGGADGGEPIFDPEVLIDAGFEPPEIPEMLDIYAESARRDLDAMTKAIEARDAGAYQNAAHTLKGSSGMIGAQRMHTLLATLMGQDDLNVLAMGLRQAEVAYATVCEAMNAWRQSM